MLVQNMGNDSSRAARKSQGGKARQPLEDQFPAQRKIIRLVSPPLEARQFSLRQRFATRANKNFRDGRAIKFLG
jgi:hypothetical protein